MLFLLRQHHFMVTYAAPKSVKKCSRLSGNFSDHPENIQPIQKLSRLSGNFPDHPENIQKLSKKSGKYPDYLETFQTICKCSRLSGNFPDHLETSQCNFKGYAQKLSGRAKSLRMAMPRCHDGFCASDLAMGFKQ